MLSPIRRMKRFVETEYRYLLGLLFAVLRIFGGLCFVK